MKRPFIGIGGKQVEAYESEIEMKVKHFPKSFTLPVAFVDSPSVDILLGQEGFFDRFRIKFEKGHGTFVVERVDYVFFCESRQAGWVRNFGIQVHLFVR